MKTYKELKDFCETKNVRHEVHPIFGKPYEYPVYENGKPTGKVTKETWRLEYAENQMEQRGFIYNDMETALLHAQHKS